MKAARSLSAARIASFATAFLLLAPLAASTLPLEADQLSKIAKIRRVVAGDEWFALVDGGGYRSFPFAFWYLATALVVSPFPPAQTVLVTNLWSAVLGASTATTLADLARILTGVAVPWTLLLFASCPILVLTQVYGNEMALALFLFVLSARLALSRSPTPWGLSGFFFALAVWSRMDIVLLAPAWLMTFGLRHDDRGRESAIRAGTAAVATAAAFFLVFVREVNVSGEIPEATSPLVAAGFVFYAFGPALLGLAVVGLVRMMRANARLAWWTLAIGAPPVLVYAPTLTSPKYVAPAAVSVVLLAGAAFAASGARARLAAVAILCAGWFVSVTPYGVRAGSDGAWWYVPSADGPVPTGSYLAFYARALPTYRERYRSEIASAGALLEVSRASRQPLRWLSNRSDVHALRFVAGEAEEIASVVDLRTLAAEDASRFFMDLKGYSRLALLDASSREIVDRLLAEARISPAVAGDEPFPPLVELGTGIIGDPDLARRVRFLNDEWTGAGVALFTRFAPPLGATCWRRDRGERDAPEAIAYRDARYVAHRSALRGCEWIVSPWFAQRYARHRPPFPREAEDRAGALRAPLFASISGAPRRFP